MPLTTTVDEAIAQEIEDRLSPVVGITVIRERRDPELWTPEDKQVVIVKKSPERVREADYPGNPPAVAYSCQFNIRCHVFQSERDDESKGIQIGELVALVHNGLTDATNWYQWNSLAFNTELGAIEYVTNDGGFDCAVIQLTVFYRFSETNPYEVR